MFSNRDISRLLYIKNYKYKKKSILLLIFYRIYYNINKILELRELFLYIYKKNQIEIFR